MQVLENNQNINKVPYKRELQLTLYYLFADDTNVTGLNCCFKFYWESSRNRELISFKSIFAQLIRQKRKENVSGGFEAVIVGQSTFEAQKKLTHKEQTTIAHSETRNSSIDDRKRTVKAAKLTIFCIP